MLSTTEWQSDALAAYAAGEDIRSIARHAGKSWNTVAALLDLHGVRILKWPRWTGDAAALAADYAAGMKLSELAVKYRCTKSTASNVLKRQGVALRAKDDYRRQPTASDWDDAAIAYGAGEALSPIARRLGVYEGRLREQLTRRGVQIRQPRNEGPEWTKERIDQAVGWYVHDGISRSEIARRLGCGTRFVTALFLRLDMTPAHRGSGKRQRGYLGERKVTSGGYIAVKIAADDPCASMRQSNGDVLEHRIVMARHIGRPLLPTETVHHINGHTMDNRPENLQLRFGQHGNGVAVRCLDCGSHNIGPTPL